jgi:hypothetical protein
VLCVWEEERSQIVRMDERHDYQENKKHKLLKKCGHEYGYKCCCNSNTRDFIDNPIDAVEEMNRAKGRIVGGKKWGEK